jgi:general secretion pathway protein K
MVNLTSLPIVHPKKQSGTVLVTVLLVVAFVVVLVVEASKTVNYQTSLNRNLMNRDQAFSYLVGMEELAKIYLKKAFDAEKEDIVHLGQEWAQQDITFPIDGGAMTASISDMQSCLNINSVITPDPTGNATNTNASKPLQGADSRDEPPRDNSGRDDDPNRTQGPRSGEIVLTNLLEKVLDSTEVQVPALVAALSDWIDNDFKPSGPDGVEDLYYQGLEIPYLPPNGPIAHVSELRTIRYFDADSYQRLRPYICALPDSEQSALNVNTITQEKAELLYAALGGKIPQSEVNELISQRPEAGYDMQTFWESVSEPNKISNGLRSRLTDTSKYFLMDAKAEINRTRVYMKTVFIKQDNNTFKVVSRYFGKE